MLMMVISAFFHKSVVLAGIFHLAAVVLATMNSVLWSLTQDSAVLVIQRIRLLFTPIVKMKNCSELVSVTVSININQVWRW